MTGLGGCSDQLQSPEQHTQICGFLPKFYLPENNQFPQPLLS